MLKICDSSISKLYQVMLRTCVKNGVFPFEWEKANVTPEHKKDDKQILENYRPIFFLPIC